MGREWSDQQRAIFQWFRVGAGHLVVRARAGTGKTTTILEAINFAPETSIMLCAFNKRIADELTARLRNPRAQAKTLHGLGFGLIRRQWSGVRVDDERGFRLAKRAWAAARGGSPDNAPDYPASLIKRLAAVIKNTSPTTPGVEDVVDMAYAFGVVPENGWEDKITVQDLAVMALDACASATDRDGTIDFDDMVWLPVANRWLHPTYDLVVVDEAQDMNAVQLALAMGLCRGRMAVVGDDKQAIYGFRGADSNAIDRLRGVLDALELPLTVTYRCPKAVVAEALPLCPDFIAAPTAPEGQVLRATTQQMLRDAEPSDFILSRLNAPLAKHCLALYRMNKRARIEGRDMTKALVALIRRQKTDAVPELLARLNVWLEREADKLRATKRQSAQARIDVLYDQYETLEALSEGLAGVPELLARIDEMFGEQRGPCVVLSTVHRAKGLEAPRVFVLADTLYCRGKRVDQEEKNIHYVAVTRAKETLVMVRDPQSEVPPVQALAALQVPPDGPAASEAKPAKCGGRRRAKKEA